MGSPNGIQRKVRWGKTGGGKWPIFTLKMGWVGPISRERGCGYPEGQPGAEFEAEEGGDAGRGGRPAGSVGLAELWDPLRLNLVRFGGKWVILAIRSRPEEPMGGSLGLWDPEMGAEVVLEP